MRKTAYLTLVVAYLLGGAVLGWAQESSAPQEPPDLVAYRPIYDPATPAATKIYLAETFLAETRPAFLESTYREYVFVILYKTYKEEKTWVKALETVDRIEKLVPKTPVERRLAYYDEAMRIANVERNDNDKTIEYAERIIALEPNNVPALMTLASAIPSTQASDPAAQVPILMKTIGYARKVQTLDKPASVPEDLWKSNLKTIRAQAQGLVAQIHLINKEYVECVKAYEEVIQMTPRDAAAQYRLGICHYYLVQDSNKLLVDKNDEYIEFVKKCNKEENCGDPDKEKSIADYVDKVAILKKDFEQKRDKAIDAFACSVAIGGIGPEPAAARLELEKLYRTITNQSPPVALDDFIAQKKRELGV